MARNKSFGVRTVLQFSGREFNLDDLQKRVLDNWACYGNEAKDLDSLDIYVKPEDEKVYYVANQTAMGSIDL